jgi:hypothetical protein
VTWSADFHGIILNPDPFRNPNSDPILDFNLITDRNSNPVLLGFPVPDPFLDPFPDLVPDLVPDPFPDPFPDLFPDLLPDPFPSEQFVERIMIPTQKMKRNSSFSNTNEDFSSLLMGVKFITLPFTP